MAAVCSESFSGFGGYRRIMRDRPTIMKRDGNQLLDVFLEELLRRLNCFCEVRRCTHLIGKTFGLRLQEFRRDQTHAFKRLQPARGSEGVEIDDRKRAGQEVATAAQLCSMKDRLTVIDAEEDDVRTGKNLGDAGLAVGLHTNPSPVSDGLSQELDLSSVFVSTV